MILACASASAQKATVSPSQPINLDRELEGQVSPDRAASYYHYSLAKWNEDKGDLAKALSEMQAALKYNQNSPAIHLEMAVLLERTGNTSEAIQYAQKAIRLDPQDPDPHWLLANIYFKPQRGDSTGEGMQKAVQELEALKELTPNDERVYYALGGAYFEIDAPEKAIEAFEKFQSLSMNADNGYREIAKYYERNGDHEKAVEYLSKGLKARPDSTESLALLGSIYSKLNKGKEAVPIYRKLQDLSGNNPAVTRQLAESLVEIGEYDEAVEILEKLAKTVPRDRGTQVVLGRAQIGLREFSKAIATLKPVVEADPDAVDAQFYLGVAYEQSGNLEEAAKTFSMLLNISPDHSEEAKANRLQFQQRLAAVYMEMGEYEKAIAVYQEIAKSDPKANLQLVNAYRVNRQYDKALDLGKRQYEKDSTDVHMAIIYALTLADAKKGREGVEILSRLLLSNPDNIDIYVNLSQVYLLDKKYSDAERILRRAEEKQPDSDLDKEKLKFQLATVYERQKDFDRAESVFKEILQANPNNASALNYVGYMLADQGVRLDEALKYVKGALAIDPRNGAYLDSLGWAFFKMNDLENAEKYLLEADAIVKNDPIIDDHLGDLYFKVGNYKKAEDFWTKSISIGTEPDDIQKVRRKLQSLQETLRRQKSGK
jgi:tetratricopeptide (TPR) repeat protein